MIFMISTMLIFGIFYKNEHQRNDLIKIAGMADFKTLTKAIPEINSTIEVLKRFQNQEFTA